MQKIHDRGMPPLTWEVPPLAREVLPLVVSCALMFLHMFHVFHVLS